MKRFKKSFITLVGITVLTGLLAAVIPLVGHGQGQGQAKPRFAARSFYVTQTTHNGGEALSACASGYHMASLWEIHDPSNLRYDTQLGRTKDDSGFGPPSGTVGWIHTGNDAGALPLTPGTANCNAWQSVSGNDHGTTVSLPALQWLDSASVTVPWRPFTFPCNTNQPVWCVED